MYDRYGNLVGEASPSFWAQFFDNGFGGLLWLVFCAVAIIILVMWLFSMVIITPGKHAAVLETLGKPNVRARMSGLSIKMPWPITQVVDYVNLQQQEIAADVSIKTQDNSFMGLPVKVQYRVSDSEDGTAPVKAHYELENPEQQMTSYILNSVRQSAASMDMIDLYKNRDDIESHVRLALQERFAKFGFVIENVLIDEPQPSDEVRAAFNHVIASQRKKEAAQNEADAAKIKLVGIASAEKESKKLQGEGMADMREAIAKGMELAMNALTASGMSQEQALSLLMDTNRLDTLNSAAAHGNMILVDMKGGADSFASNVAAVKAAERLGTTTSAPNANPTETATAEVNHTSRAA